MAKMSGIYRKARYCDANGVDWILETPVSGYKLMPVLKEDDYPEEHVEGLDAIKNKIKGMKQYVESGNLVKIRIGKVLDIVKNANNRAKKEKRPLVYHDNFIKFLKELKKKNRIFEVHENNNGTCSLKGTLFTFGEDLLEVWGMVDEKIEKAIQTSFEETEKS